MEHMLCVVKNTSLNAFMLGYLPAVGRGDTLIFDAGCVKSVDMNAELRGESEFFARLIALSRDKECSVLLRSVFYAAGGVFNSVAVFDKGEVCGVSDEINPRSACDPGSVLRCYNTSMGRLGVLIGEDLLYPELWARLAICAPSVVFCFNRTYRAGLSSSLAALCDCTVCAVSPERAGCYADSGALLKSGYEDISFLPLPQGRRQARVLTKKVRTSIEG